jgi:predicted esterase
MGIQRVRLTFMGAWVCMAGLGACGDEGGADGGATLPPYTGPLMQSSPAPIGNVAPSAVDAPSTSPNPATEAMTANQRTPTPPSDDRGNGAAGSAAPAVMPAPAQPMQPATPMNSAPAGVGGSAGCGASQEPPANPTFIDDPNTIITFPQSYDGSQPFPLLFAFHGANRNNQQMRMEDSRTVGSPLESNYVMAFVGSQGTAWELGTDYPRFERVLDQVLSELCIDTSAIFAMGHSSGAQFIAQMLGDNRARETRFAAVAPVSSSLFNNPPWDPIPTLLIHGTMDTARPNDLNGAEDISQYARSNQCTGGPQPVDIGPCASFADGTNVNPGCVQYGGCAATTVFCNHDDPNYFQGNIPTNHGWPCFANQEIFAFLESAR